MANHEALIRDIEDHGIRFIKRVDQLKVLIAFTQTAQSAPSSWPTSTLDARSIACVCTMAELESLTKYIIQASHDELNNSAIPLNSLVPSLRQVAAHSTFESLKQLSDAEKFWDKRRYASTLELCADYARFPVEQNHPQPPLDGKTLKPEHFYRLWSIYSLPDPVFPDPSWPGALQKLALIRNDIAHGNLPYHEIFQQAGRSLHEIEAYVTAVGDFAAHFTDTWSTYIRSSGYRL